ncbi:MAG: hypothetical protein IGNPGNKH_00298 [Sodalis sp. Ffu]|nr:MAG: hypothetical protein IGNPGNKH_00298 [Sodalis sp. Ffu]
MQANFMIKTLTCDNIAHIAINVTELKVFGEENKQSEYRVKKYHVVRAACSGDVITHNTIKSDLLVSNLTNAKTQYFSAHAVG